MISLALHKFVKLTEVNPEFAELPKVDISEDPFLYMLEVYMDYYIALSVPRSWYYLHHGVNIVMTGINDVLPSYKDDDQDVISLKKIVKKEVAWAVIKNVLGFDFDGKPGEHNIWLTEDLRINI